MLSVSPNGLALIHEEGSPLAEMVVICAWCGKIRDTQGRWKDTEEPSDGNPVGDSSHGICPECLKKTDFELYEKHQQTRGDDD